MSKRDELRELFRTADPAAAYSPAQLRDLVPAFGQVAAAFDRQGTDSKPDRNLVPRPARRRVVVIAVALLMLALLTAAAWAYIHFLATSTPLSAACYQHLDAGAASSIIDLAPGQTPAQACAQRWQELWAEPAPSALVACVMPEGGHTGVLPNPEHLSDQQACASVGADLPAEGQLYGALSAAQVIDLQADIHRRFDALRQGPGCAGADDLAREVTAALDEAGAQGWRVDDRTSDRMQWIFPDGQEAVVDVPRNGSGQTCAEYAVRASQLQVRLVNSWHAAPSPPPVSSER